MSRATSSIAGHDVTVTAEPSPGLETDAPFPLPALKGIDRYVPLAILGRGSLGEVIRVRDERLKRPVAMKILRRDLIRVAQARERLEEEGRTAASLQHPNLLPVYDAGTTSDGLPFFTMKEAPGRSLKEAIESARGPKQDPATIDPLDLRKLVVDLLGVCKAIAYAHAQGLLHRDVKPENIVLGERGEVYVVDWGLAAHLWQAPHGTVAGTPPYMAPEQAHSVPGPVNQRTDIYALGATLYTILAGQRPYLRVPTADLLQQIRNAPPVSVVDVWRQRGGPLPPAQLVETCAHAMDRDPARRLESAQQFVEQLESWLDGLRDRKHAQALLERARTTETAASDLERQAQARRSESEALLRDVLPWESEERKLVGWHHADLSGQLAEQAVFRRVEVEELHRHALLLAPDLVESRHWLIRRHLGQHRNAERGRQTEATKRAELQIRAHAEVLDDQDPVRQRSLSYLRGTGSLTLFTQPPGAQAHIFRYTKRRRRLHPEWVRDLGTTPMRHLSLEMGSYLIELKRPGHHVVRYPVYVPRLHHWDGIRPDETEPHPIWLPPLGTLDADDVYVPAGPFLAGGDPEAYGYQRPSIRPWCDGFVVKRFPVTNRQYIAFLDDLAHRGDEDVALACVPRARAGRESELGPPLYGRTPSGGFCVQRDADGDLWGLDWAVLHIDWHAAVRYAEWFAERDGRPWRLLGELEWEKAARGVDGRFYPWGDEADASWSRVRGSAPTEGDGSGAGPSDVDDYPIDSSVYGVRGTAGGVRDWCFDESGHIEQGRVVLRPADAHTRHRVVRGGAWDFDLRHVRLATIGRLSSDHRDPFVGFRLGYSPTSG